MTESEFLDLADATLNAIETALEDACDASDLDVECSRSGSLLEIEFLHNQSKIIVNGQEAVRELWVAAKSGGYHYKHDGQHWLNTRNQSELMTTLAEIALAQGKLRI